MLESSIINSSLAAINSLPNAKAVKKHGSIYSQAGDPDIDAVVNGVPYKLEAKLPGKRPTAIQSKRLREWAAAGAVTGVIYSKAEALAIIAGDEEVRALAFGRI